MPNVDKSFFVAPPYAATSCYSHSGAAKVPNRTPKNNIDMTRMADFS